MKLRSLCCLSNGERETLIHSTTSSGNKECPWEVFSLKSLLFATNNFHENNKLGEGGFGTVYWGRTTGGKEIAVKRLKTMTAKAEMEFAVEVEILGRVRHKNLLGLRGYHARGNERLIVYEYMPNQSLLHHLHGQPAADVRLSWRRRMRIAFGSAEGLAYLHHEANPHIIHRDIKASNVLLDSRLRPKVADFGFAKLIPEGVSHLTTRVKGTLGYLAPEYAMWGKVSESCDVFSFGVLLLEIVTGRRPIEKLATGKKRDIVHWARPLHDQGRWDQIADPKLGGLVDQDQLRAVVGLALECTDGCPEKRPSMNQVVDRLRAGLGLGRDNELATVERGDDDAGDDIEEAADASHFSQMR